MNNNKIYTIEQIKRFLRTSNASKVAMECDVSIRTLERIISDRTGKTGTYSDGTIRRMSAYMGSFLDEFDDTYLRKPITRDELVKLIRDGRDVTHVDTSEITDMSYLFSGDKEFNQNIGRWDTSSVTDMSFMFAGAKEFNQDITAWDTSSVTDMRFILDGATAFNEDISTWDTSSVTDMSCILGEATGFNEDISTWDTSSVTYTRRMLDSGAVRD
jgi:surface protein